MSFDRTAVYTVQLNGDTLELAAMVAKKIGYGVDVTIQALVLKGTQALQAELEAGDGDITVVRGW